MKYLLLLTVLLAGCANDLKMSRAADRCEKIGYQRGTDQFKDCQTKLMSAKGSTTVLID